MADVTRVIPTSIGPLTVSPLTGDEAKALEVMAFNKGRGGGFSDLARFFRIVQMSVSKAHPEITASKFDELDMEDFQALFDAVLAISDAPGTIAIGRA